MATDILGKALQGVNLGQGILQSQQQNQIRDLQNSLAGQAGQKGFDANNNLDFQKLAALDPDFAARSLKNFSSLDESRQKAFFLDAKKGVDMLESGDSEGFLKLAMNRRENIMKLGGDPSDVDSILESFQSGDIEGTFKQLNMAVRAGQEAGYLSVPEIDKSKQTKLGTYNPGDYTVSSWSEFAKYGDPSILQRYESDSKARSMEIREQAQVLKEEKHKLEQQKLEMDNLKKDLESKKDKKDTDRASYLEVKEADNAINNISTLLSGDLDLIYGGMEWILPDKLRSQKGKNMIARRDQVSSTMSLMAAGKLKGQGTITENEREMLRRAATILGNDEISAEQASEELNRIMPIFEYFKTGVRPSEAPNIKDPALSLEELKAMRERLNANNR